MKSFLHHKRKKLCLYSTLVCVGLVTALLYVANESFSDFGAGVILSLILLSPLYLMCAVQFWRAEKLLKRQKQEYGCKSEEVLDVIGAHLAQNDDWLIYAKAFDSWVLHREAIESIRETEGWLLLYTALRKKPFVLKLSKGQSGDFEKEKVLNWYDPLYEIPLVDEEEEKKAANLKVIRAAVLFAAVLFLGGTVLYGLYQEEIYIGDTGDTIYFYEYLTETSSGTLDEISVETVKNQDEVLLYVFNENDVYAELELELYDSEDNCTDTVWTGVIRPHHYTMIYIEEKPATVKAVGAWFTVVEYHAPSFAYEVEYAQRGYTQWINVFLEEDLLTIENLRELGLHEYAIEELAYTGADSVYVYDKDTALKTVDKTTGTEMWDISSAQYRIDFELFDYRIQLIELKDDEETLLETIEVTVE